MKSTTRVNKMRICSRSNPMPPLPPSLQKTPPSLSRLRPRALVCRRRWAVPVPRSPIGRSCAADQRMARRRDRSWDRRSRVTQTALSEHYRQPRVLHADLDAPGPGLALAESQPPHAAVAHGKTCVVDEKREARNPMRSQAKNYSGEEMGLSPPRRT